MQEVFRGRKKKGAADRNRTAAGCGTVPRFTVRGPPVGSGREHGDAPLRGRDRAQGPVVPGGGPGTTGRAGAREADGGVGLAVVVR
ncbi:hypothetical protein GCM10010400_25820 [Streptomyces aculeolatus]